MILGEVTLVNMRLGLGESGNYMNRGSMILGNIYNSSNLYHAKHEVVIASTLHTDWYKVFNYILV